MKIAHFRSTYLNQSETFIWQYLAHFKNITPIVLCNQVANLDQFQVERGEVIVFGAPRWSREWFVNKWYANVMGMPNGACRRILREKDVKVLHGHFGWTGANLVSLAIAEGLPLVTSFYGTDLSEQDVLKKWRQAYVRLFQIGSLFLVEGPALKQKLVSLGCPDEKIHIQRIAIPADSYQITHQIWDGSRPIRLLFVGRLTEKKGLEYALRALATAGKKFPIEFQIIGDGPLRASLERLAVELNIANHVNWLGMRSHKFVVEALKLCDIFIHPSVTAKNGNSEGGAPTIIIEAQAVGIPILTTKHADIPYVTLPNESALLADERDIDGLSRNLMRLLNEPERWSIMGRAGRDHVLRFHNINKEAASLERHYARVAN